MLNVVLNGRSEIRGLAIAQFADYGNQVVGIQVIFLTVQRCCMVAEAIEKLVGVDVLAFIMLKSPTMLDVEDEQRRF